MLFGSVGEEDVRRRDTILVPALAFLLTVLSAPQGRCGDAHKQLWEVAHDTAFDTIRFTDGEVQIEEYMEPLEKMPGLCLTGGYLDRNVERFFFEQGVFAYPAGDGEIPQECTGVNTYLEDRANNFLFTHGDGSPCGCFRLTVSRAFPRKKGKTLVVGHAWMACSLEDGSIASESLAAFLPPDLAPQSFLKEGETAGPEEVSLFILRLLPSRTAPTVTARLDALPLGIQQPPLKKSFRHKLDVEYVNTQRGDLTVFGAIALYGGPKMDKALADESCDTLTGKDLEEAIAIVATLEKEEIPDGPPRFPLSISGKPSEYSLERFKEEFRHALGVYRAVSKQAWRDIILQWNRDTGRFQIKRPARPIPPMTFREFLLRVDYYYPVC